MAIKATKQLPTRRIVVPERSLKLPLPVNTPIPEGEDATPKQELTNFTSKATSSKSLPPYWQLNSTSLRRWAQRRGVGTEKHGDINYKSCVTISADKRVKVLDLGFVRDRFNHLIEHCYKLVDAGTKFDDNIGAIFANVEMLEWVERQGFSLQRVFNPDYCDETELAILAETNELLWVAYKNGIYHYSNE